MNLKIKDIINATNGKLIIGNEEKECENFIRDTRIAKNGDTYIALKGENHDGNLLWKEAFENGADTVIVQISINEDLKKYKNKNIIQVKDTKKALKQIALAKRELYKDLLVVGVTGSVGKTSTKDIIANVLSQKYKTLKTQGNMNNEIGLPLTILNLRDHKAAVIEMGMNHLGEISTLTNIAKPTIAVITNVGTSHIGNLGSRENILKAKLEILEGMNNKNIVINNDNDMLSMWAKKLKEGIEIHTFGIQNQSEIMAEDIQRQENSSTFKAVLKKKEYNNINKLQDIHNKKELTNEEIYLKVPVGGDAFILNSLCATLVGKQLGLKNEEISKGIESFELTKKRMEISKKEGITIINDSYNASLDSMKAALQYLSQTNSKRKIAVLGDMFELGEFSEALHREVGKEVVKNKIDQLYVIGKDAKYILEEAQKEKIQSYYAETKEELLKKIKEIMTDGDVILFKASNGMKLFEIVDELKD